MRRDGTTPSGAGLSGPRPSLLQGPPVWPGLPRAPVPLQTEHGAARATRFLKSIYVDLSKSNGDTILIPNVKVAKLDSC